MAVSSSFVTGCEVQPEEQVYQDHPPCQPRSHHLWKNNHPPHPCHTTSPATPDKTPLTAFLSPIVRLIHTDPARRQTRTTTAQKCVLSHWPLVLPPPLAPRCIARPNPPPNPAPDSPAQDHGIATAMPWDRHPRAPSTRHFADAQCRRPAAPFNP